MWFLLICIITFFKFLCYHNQQQILVFILQYQRTSLHHACLFNRYDIIQLLLNFNADPNLCDKVSVYIVSVRDYYMLLDLDQVFNLCRMFCTQLLQVSISTFCLNLLLERLKYHKYYQLSVDVACYNCRHPWKNPCIHTSISCHLCQHVLM